MSPSELPADIFGQTSTEIPKRSLLHPSTLAYINPQRNPGHGEDLHCVTWQCTGNALGEARDGLPTAQRKARGNDRVKDKDR